MLNELKLEMNILIDSCKDDYLSNEVQAIKEELVKAIEIADMLENIEIKLISSLNSFMFRCWLFEYKNRYFILSDESNGHYGYLCMPEEALQKLSYC